MKGNIYGYVRVSTREQNTARQLIAMRTFGVDERNIVVEQQSGKDFDRPLYHRLIQRLRPEDTLVIKSIDRLGRNYAEILDQWRHITKTLQTAIVVLDMPLPDTRRGRDLTGTLIADIVLQLLSYVAQTERENTRQRQLEGITAAKSRGVRFGPGRMELPEGFWELARLWHRGGVSSRTAARQLGISYQTFLRRAKEYQLPPGPDQLKTPPRTISAAEHFTSPHPDLGARSGR